MEEEEQQEKTLREQIVGAIEEVNKPEEIDSGRDETGKFKAKEETETPEVKAEEKPKYTAPSSWSATAKEKWNALDPDVQAEVFRREEETHKGFTKLDEERNFGKSIKEAITPYMPIIQSEGGEPVKAVKDLLNTAYMLRTAPPARKAALVQEIIKTYGVDMNLLQESNADPAYAQLQQQIADLQRTTNPEAIRTRLREEMEEETVVKEVKAFASDPANVHYEKVKAVMSSLLHSGVSKNMKEAYEAACRADPEVFSTLEAKKQADEQAKKNADIAAKKKAASSLTGSPGVTVPNTGAPDRSLRDELLANLRAATS